MRLSAPRARRFTPPDADVVEGDVDAAVGGFDVLCYLADAGGIRQIPLKELHAEFYGGFIAFLLVDVDDDDARTDAVSNPIPLAPPVTMATRLSKFSYNRMEE